MKRTTTIAAALLMVAGARAEIITVNDDADAEIKQHVNYADTNFGTTQGAYVGRWDTRYQNPVEAPHHWTLIHWDLSGIDSSATVSDVTLQLQCIEYGVGITDVYAIDSGAWTETGVTWNNWAPTATDTLLGSMTDVPKDQGVTTFNNAALTSVVQDWIDGDKANLGLVFKWNSPAPGNSGGEYAVGDNFATREYTESAIDPQLVVTIPEPATLGLVGVMGAAIVFIRKHFS